MNALIHEVLSKKASNNVEVNLIVKTLAKPKIITNVSCSITVDDPFIFYTFDGRSLFFSEEESSPSMSIPDETKHVEFISAEGKDYVFLLNSKNRLECCDLELTLSKSRYIITRNVIKMQKSEGKIYFIFKKEQGYFINECSFDGKKWMGKTLCTISQLGNIEMFATGGGVYYISEGKVFNTSGEYIGIKADYLHRYKDVVIAASLNDNGYTISTLDINTGYTVVDTFTLSSDDVVLGIEAHEDYLIVKLRDRLILLKIDPKDKNFIIKWMMKYETEVYEVGFSVKDNTVTAYILADNASPEVKETISESNIELKGSDSMIISDTPSLDDKEDQTKSLSGSDSFDSSEFFYEDKDQFRDNKKSSILKEMESLSIVPKNRDQSSPTRPKSNLLEEVKATLNKKKAVAINSSIPETVEPQKPVIGECPIQDSESFSDRFEIFKKANLLKKMPSEETKIPSSPKKKNEPVKKDIEISNSDLISNPEPPKLSNVVCNEETVKLNKLEKTLNQMSSQCKEILEQIKVQKESQPKLIIKEMMLSHLIPCVEACFNEMRIQMMTEIKKMLSSSICQEDSKITSIKKHLSNKKSTQAIYEFLKLDDDEINSYLHLFTPGLIESADPKAIFELLIKVSELVKASPTEVHFNLIATCLMDIEVGVLSVDEIQDLSVLIRSIKDLEDFDKERYPDLGCVMEIISKKIRKRAKQGSSK